MKTLQKLSVDRRRQAVVDEINRKNDVNHFIDLLKRKAAELLRPFLARDLKGEVRSAAEWPHLLPAEKPRDVRPEEWNRAKYAVDLLIQIQMLEDSLKQGTQPRVIGAHAMRMGALAVAINLAPLEVFARSEERRRLKAAEGGKKSRKWTHAVETKARQIYIQEKAYAPSVEDALKRTRKRLLAEHEIKVGLSTLRNKLPQTVAV
jgi:hypothetical protein